MVVATPNCQPYSTASGNPRGLGDLRGWMLPSVPSCVASFRNLLATVPKNAWGAVDANGGKAWTLYVTGMKQIDHLCVAGRVRQRARLRGADPQHAAHRAQRAQCAEGGARRSAGFSGATARGGLYCGGTATGRVGSAAAARVRDRGRPLAHQVGKERCSERAEAHAVGHVHQHWEVGGR